MNKDERRQRILQIMTQPGGKKLVGTRELAAQFGVSEMTVRRDLQELAQSGMLRRQHGGAAPLHTPRELSRKEIGILLESQAAKYSDPFFNAVLEGADRRLQHLGYRIAYISTGGQDITAAQARDLLRSVSVSGIVVIGRVLSMENVDFFKANVRALVGIIEPLGDGFDTVTCDHYTGIRQMVDHLAGLGHRRIGFITAHYDDRERAFRDGITANEFAAEPELCVHVPAGIEGWTPRLGHAGAQQLMQLRHPPDAIICASDWIAVGVIQWLHQHGFRVPDDVAVTGFDGIPESAFTVPSLTTVHVHKELMGELAAERVVRRIENPNEIPLFIQTPTHVIIRNSCGTKP
jgi:DNA-binding LacI/PurR family transcriptional regulator